MVGGHHFQQTGHQPGMVANPARGQLNKEKWNLPCPRLRLRVWSLRMFRPASVRSFSTLRLNLVLTYGTQLPLPPFRYGFPLEP